MAKHPKGWGSPKRRAPKSTPIKLEHKEGTWAPVDGHLVREEWQILNAGEIHIFYTEAEAKLFHELRSCTWPGREGGVIHIEIRHVIRHLHNSEKA
jgi:hypothetical protein